VNENEVRKAADAFASAHIPSRDARRHGVPDAARGVHAGRGGSEVRVSSRSIVHRLWRDAAPCRPCSAPSRVRSPSAAEILLPLTKSTPTTRVLRTPSPHDKAALTDEIAALWAKGDIRVAYDPDPDAKHEAPPDKPARYARPRQSSSRRAPETETSLRADSRAPETKPLDLTS